MFEWINIEAIVHWMLALGGIYVLIIAVLMAAHHNDNKRNRRK